MEDKTHTPDVLIALLDNVLNDDRIDNMVYLNAMVLPAHKVLLNNVSLFKSQQELRKVKLSESLRSMMDEWCVYKKAELLALAVDDSN